MIKVQLDHNPYIPNLTISIDGQPISQFSQLFRYQKTPFTVWCGDIIDSINRELNGAEFEIEYYGRKTEAEILAAFARRDAKAQRVIHKEQDVSHTARERLAILNRLENNGIICAKTRIKPDVVLYSDSPDYCAIPRDILPPTRFYKITTTVLPIAQLNTLPKSTEIERIVICHSFNDYLRAKEQCYTATEMPFFMLLEDEKPPFIDVIDNSVVFHCCKSVQMRVLQEIIEIRGSIRLLKAWMNSIQDTELFQRNSELMMLTQTKARIELGVPHIVEVGEKSPISISIYPHSATIKPDIVFRKSDSSIISITSDLFICAQSTGQVRVEAYRRDTGDLIGDYTISAIKRRKVRRINISAKNYTLTEGERQPLTLSFEPPDADNINTLSYESSDPLIAYMDEQRQEIITRNTGCCEITIHCEKVQCAFTIDVRPQISDFEITLEKAEMIVDETQHYTIKQLPERSIPGQYAITITPPGSLYLDHASRIICAKMEGDASIVFQNGTISKSITVHVLGKNTRNHQGGGERKKRGLHLKMFGKREG